MEQKIDVENSQETKKYWIRVIKKLLSVVLVLVGLFLALKCAIFLLPFVPSKKQSSKSLIRE